MGIIGLIRIGLIVAVVAALTWFVHSYNEGRREEGRAEVRIKEVAPLKRQLADAQQRATDIANQWSAQLEKAAGEARKYREELRVKTEQFARRAQELSRAPTVVLSAASARLWGDVADSAQGSPTVPAQPVAGAQTISESALVGWVNDAAEAYKDAVGLFHECRDTLRGYVNAFTPGVTQ